MGAIIFWVSFWVALSFVAAQIASGKGRSYGGILFLSLIFSPVIGLLVAFALAPNATAIEAQKVSTGESKKCPFCAEVIKSEALVCRFCGRDQNVEKEDSKASVGNSGQSSYDKAMQSYEEALQKLKIDLTAADEAIKTKSESIEKEK